MLIHTWTAKDAQEKIPDRNAKWLRTNRLFYHGDHWQKGEGWVGPTVPTDNPKYSSTMGALERIFVSKNMVASVIDNHAQGVIGRTPHWIARPRRKIEPDELPTSEEAKILDEAQGLIQLWIESELTGIKTREGDTNEIRTCTPIAAIEAAIKEGLRSTRGTLRFIVAKKAQPGIEDTDLLIPRETIDKLVPLIRIQATSPTQATVYFDPDELAPIGIFVYQETRDGNTTILAELSYQAENGETVLTIIGDETKGETSANIMQLHLGGNLMHYEIELPRFITPQVLSAQRALNKAKTMESKNLDAGGFLERVILNAEMPGKWELDATTGEETFVPKPLQIGPAMTTFLKGVEQQRADGTIDYASPSVVYREPTKPDAFIDSAEDFEHDILLQCAQLHRAMEGSSNMSGISRTAAKDTFRQSLGETKTETDKAISWMLETMLSLAAALSGQPGRYDSIRIVGDAQLDIGNVSNQEHTQNLAAFAARLQSAETTMSNIGIEDVQAEMSRIKDTATGDNSVNDDPTDDTTSEPTK